MKDEIQSWLYLINKKNKIVDKCIFFHRNKFCPDTKENKILFMFFFGMHSLKCVSIEFYMSLNTFLGEKRPFPLF